MQREPNKMWFHIAWHKILRLLALKVNKIFEKNGQESVSCGSTITIEEVRF